MNLTGESNHLTTGASGNNGVYVNADIAVTSWVIGQGYSNSLYWFCGNITGSGPITINWGGVNNANNATRTSFNGTKSGTIYRFSGDMSGYSGNITSTPDTFALEFTNDKHPDSTSERALNNACVSGTGQISVAGELNYKVSGTSTIKNSLLKTTGTLSFFNNATVDETSGETTNSVYNLGDGTKTNDATDVAIEVGTMVIKSGVKVIHASDATLSVTSALNIEEGATFKYEPVLTDSTDDLSAYKFSGAGVVELAAHTSNWNTVINLGKTFTGETHVTSGQLNLEGTVAGSKLVLEDGVNVQLKSSGSGSWGGNLQLNGEHTIHSNSGVTFTMNGNVSGSNGTWNKASTGTLTFSSTGSVNLGKFTQNNSGTTTFSGTSTIIGEVQQSSNIIGVLVFTNGATLGTVTSVGQLNFTGGKTAINTSLTANILSIGSEAELELATTADSNTITTLSGTGLLTHSGSSSTTVTSASDFYGSVAVTAGSLTLGTEGQSVTMGLGGTINVSSGAALYLYNSFTNVNLTDLDTTTDEVSWSDSANGNGYAGATYILVENSGSTTVGSGITVNGHALNEGVFDGENVTFTVDATGGNYYVNNNVNNAALVYGTGTTISSDATTGIILNGGNLDMQISLNDAAENGITAYKNATINLASNAVTLEQSKLSINETVSVTLTGSGTYKLASNTKAMTTRVTLGSAWTGTVVMHEVTGDQNQLNTILNDLTSGTSSKVQLSGVNAWLSTQSTDRSILLENLGDGTAALTLNNGSTHGGGIKTAEFAGSVGGSGDIVFYWNTDSNTTTQRHLFSNDTSTWSGKFINENSNTMALLVEFNQQGSVFSSTVDGGGIVNKNAATTDADKTGGKLTVKFNNSGNIDFYGTVSKTEGASETEIEVAQGKVTLHKQVTVDGATVAQNATAKVNSTLTAGTVSNAGQIKLVEAATVTGGSMSKVQMSSTGITGTAQDGSSSIANADIEIAQLAQDASFTIADMTLTNTTITATTVDTKVNLQNVEASNVVLDKGKFSTDAPMSVVGAGGTAFSASTSAITKDSSITINASAGASLAVDLGDLSCVTAMGPGKYELSITLNGVGFDSYENLAAGSGIIFAADSWLGQLLTAQGATVYVSGAVETPASVSEGGSTGGVSVSYSAATGGNVGTVITISGLNVPEPATSTLSLLALAALAARRRRK